MDVVTVNYLAVLVAGLAYMVLGALWYSPVLFGKPWMKAIGKTKEQVAADFSPVNYFWGIITALVAAYGIARIMSWTGGHTVGDGLLTGLLAGICFVLTSMWVNDTFEARSRGLTVLNVLYHVIGLAITGVIIGAW